MKLNVMQCNAMKWNELNFHQEKILIISTDFDNDWDMILTSNVIFTLLHFNTYKFTLAITNNNVVKKELTFNFATVYLVHLSLMVKWCAVLSSNISYECLNVIVTLSPVILTQELLHRSNVLQFVQEPLVYGS